MRKEHLQAIWDNQANGGGNSARIAFLKKKQADLAAQLAAEQEKIRRRMDRETARAVEIVGKAVIQMGTSSKTVFRSTVKEVAVGALAGTFAALLLTIALLTGPW